MNATADPRCSDDTAASPPLQHAIPIGILGPLAERYCSTLRASRILVDSTMVDFGPSVQHRIPPSGRSERSLFSTRIRPQLHRELESRPDGPPDCASLEHWLRGSSRLLVPAFALAVVALAYVLARACSRQQSRSVFEGHIQPSQPRRPESRKSRSVLPQAGHRSVSRGRDERAGVPPL